MSKRGGKMKVAELFDLTGKVAIVTGGSIGLGRQMAEALAEQGANVVIAARKVERCQEVADELAKEFGVKTLAVRCDVGVTEDCENLIAATVKEFGTVDIMVNNASLALAFLRDSAASFGVLKKEQSDPGHS
jgi:NAD(P)-dependent dehydrogenase (short-subunit alcohol dehydrogenase family)